MTQFPTWFAGKADVTGGTVVALVNDDAELIAHEAEVAPGHWKLFPDTAAGQAAANAYVGSSDPKGDSTTPGDPVTGAISSLTGVNAIGGFFSDLGQRNTWLRVGKVAIGLVLIIVGLVQITHAQKVISSVAEAGAIAA
jgi:hypothetical protein